MAPLDLACQLLGRGAEGHPAQPCKLGAQHGDHTIAGIDLSLEAGDPGVPIGWRNGVLRHSDLIPDRGRRCEQKRRNLADYYPAKAGCQVRSGRRQSIPSSSIESCAADR